MHLYFGGRDPESDFLYRREIQGWLDDRRLTSLSTVFSRVSGGGYVGGDGASSQTACPAGTYSGSGAAAGAGAGGPRASCCRRRASGGTSRSS